MVWRDIARRSERVLRAGRRLVHTHKFASSFLQPTAANYEPLTPLSLLDRADRLFPHRTAVSYVTESGTQIRRTWAETATRSRRLASGLARLGVTAGDTVSVIAPNTPAMVEAHFGVIGSGAVLHTINTRLDPAIVAFQLEHGESQVILADAESISLVKEALMEMEPRHWPLIVEIRDDEAPFSAPGHEKPPPKGFKGLTYEGLLALGDPNEPLLRPEDENSAIALSYTSGTTGNPKGVVTSHRGALLNAMANCAQAPMPHRPAMALCVPLFHCNGWCYVWTMAAMGGVNVCLRHVRASSILDVMASEGVTHMGGAPVVMNLLLQASDEEKARFRERRRGMGEIGMVTAGSSPPPSVICRLLSELNIRAVGAYGLTETYGPVTATLWENEWGAPPSGDAQAAAAVDKHLTWQAHSPFMGDMIVAELPGGSGSCKPSLPGKAAPSVQPVPMDGQTMGEVLFRGNTVMLGYLKNEKATLEAFEGGYFRTGDLAVYHPGGRVEIKDRMKDLIISGGENINSIEVESALHRHPAVSAAAVVAIEDDFWGEAPCAVIELVEGQEATEEDIIRHCRDHLAAYKCPRKVLFEGLPKTSTGKIQKFQLRHGLQKRGIRGPGKPKAKEQQPEDEKQAAA